jgi:hypothetical protein
MEVAQSCIQWLSVGMAVFKLRVVLPWLWQEEEGHYCNLKFWNYNVIDRCSKMT